MLCKRYPLLAARWCSGQHGLPQSKDMHVRLIEDYTLPVGGNVWENGQRS